MTTPSIRHSPTQPFNLNSLPSHAANMGRENTSKHQAAVILGSSTSEKKAQTSAANGKQGGRPKGS